MRSVKFIVVFDRRKLKPCTRVKGIIGHLYGFLDDRKWHEDRSLTIMQKIFGYVHIRASHRDEKSRKIWKTAERRMMNRCKNI